MWRIDSLDERLALAADSGTAMYADAVQAADADTGVEFLTAATLQGSIFVDSQRNLVHDQGEPGIAGVEVKLVDQLGNVVASQQTGADGEFLFLGVDPGLYDLESAAINGSVEGGQRAGSSAGDALFERAIRGIDLSPGELAEGYAFTVLSPEIKPGEPISLPKPILHEDAKPDPTFLGALALANASPARPPMTGSDVAREIKIEVPFVPAAMVPPSIDLPFIAGSTLGIPASGLDAVDKVDTVKTDAVAIASVAEHGVVPTMWTAKAAIHSSVTLSGDFDGDGQQEAATFDRGQWWIDRDGNGERSAGDLEVELGPADGLPVVADIDGDGKDEVVVVSQGMAKQWLRHVQPKRTASSHIHAFAGDWLGTGRESIGLSTAGEWWLDLNGNRQIDAGDRFGEGTIATGAQPTVADANHDGVDELVWGQPSQGDTEMSSRNADRAFESLYER